MIKNAKRWAPGGMKPYALAVLGLATASSIRYALHPILQDKLPFMLFIVSALLVEFYLGLGPALVVVAGGYFIGTYYFVPPYGEFLMPEAWDLVYTVGYFAIVLLGIALIESLQRSKHGARLMRDVAQSRLEMFERGHAVRIQAEEAARFSEKQYQALASNMPQVWYMRRVDGNFEYVNDEFYELTGVAPGSLEENGWLHSIHPDDAKGVQSSWVRIAATGEECRSEFRLRMADGAYRYFTGRLSCVEDKRGKIIKWIGVSHEAALADHALAGTPHHS